MFYYLEQNNNIVIADNDLSRLQTTLDFLPQYEGLKIKESDVDIIQYKDKWYFVNDEEYIRQKEQEEKQKRNQEIDSKIKELQEMSLQDLLEGNKSNVNLYLDVINGLEAARP